MVNGCWFGVGSRNSSVDVNGGRGGTLVRSVGCEGRYWLGPIMILVLVLHLSSNSRAKLTSLIKDEGHLVFT